MGRVSGISRTVSILLLQLVANIPSTILQALGWCQDLQDLQIFANDVAESGITMIIFLDQANALDDESAGRVPASIRGEVSLFLARFSYKHLLIQSASGNFKMADLAQEIVAQMYMSGGLTEVNP